MTQLNAVEITDKEKLENTLQSMLGVQDGEYFTRSTTVVIGKTKNQVITLTVHRRCNYEDEFSERFDDISDKHICLSVNSRGCQQEER